MSFSIKYFIQDVKGLSNPIIAIINIGAVGAELRKRNPFTVYIYYSQSSHAVSGARIFPDFQLYIF